MVKKASVTLGGVVLAANAAISWKLVTGVTPYTTPLSVHKSAWASRLKAQIGKPLDLLIVNGNGTRTTIKGVYILHELPSDSPNRVTFLVADKRWLWQYPLVVRDYNIPRKTGDRTAKFTSVPVEARETFDKYDYLAYSLDKDERKWTPKRAVEDVLEQIEGEKLASKKKKRKKGKRGPLSQGKGWKIDSFPIETKGGGEGQFTLQNVMLRDQGNVALSRLLSYIPGAEIYIDVDGKAVVFDGTDLDAVEQHFSKLPPSTWAGEKAAYIDRKEIRPGTVIVHYQREVEVVFDFDDDYSSTTSADPNADAPYLENVIPTVDPETDLIVYDPEKKADVSTTVPPGTWVPVKQWLAAMDSFSPEDSLPWTFDTIKRHWLKGDLDGVLGGRGLDLDEEANVSMRIQALKQHFRQTFRINRRYMERIRNLLAVRVALLDPVTGARAPAAVWGQACVIPSTKGKLMGGRKDPEKAKVYRNVDYLAPSTVGDTKIIDTAPGPTRVNMLDKELGIFRLEWITSPYGTVDSFVPCHLVGENSQGVPKVITRDVAKQDTEPMGAAMKVEAGTNGIFLRSTMDYRVILTLIPAAPNNERQFHREEVKASDLPALFRKEFRIQSGDGPDLEVFVTPGEATARFAWDTDREATLTIRDLLGLKDADPETTGLEGPDLPGFVLINEKRHLTDHAKSFAAELLANFADNIMGTIATRVPERGGKLRLVGNMSGTTLRVGAAPSAKVDVVHQFPGQQKPISRLGLMSETTRQLVLGTIPFKE